MKSRSQHSITAVVSVNFVPVSLQEEETVCPTLRIAFTYLPGYAATGPTYACGGEPACPAEVEFVSAELIDGDGVDPTPDQIATWAEEYLCSDEGYGAAVQEAGQEREFEREEWEQRLEGV